ncbi:DUF2637 domain-containing protein [Streptomyces sp. NPDC050504]|uniref:DUF2637 domain-containing protein n=1 Tax=Streptomyces sp. NPDC050504 TaxID=3365618 RepID=UPI00378A1457
MAAMQLTRTHRILIGVVVAGAVVIAAIGFAGSYAAVRDLAEKKGFGDFSLVFPIGIDAGICVLLALDLLLTWIRIPFPLLRQTAWLLTAATIAFNGAAAWPDPLGVGMHAVIPVLFVVSVEAARHAVGRIADITADKHMEGVRLTRWLLSPVPTFKLWRRMKLWELRSYEQVIKLEQDRLVYQARLQARFGRGWRRKAPVESLMPLRLAKFGVPLAETAPAGLAAAGIEPMLLPPNPVQAQVPELPAQQARQARPVEPVQQPVEPVRQPVELVKQPQAPEPPRAERSDYVPEYVEEHAVPATHESPWFASQPLEDVEYHGGYDHTFVPEEDQEQEPEPLPEESVAPEPDQEYAPEPIPDPELDVDEEPRERPAPRRAPLRPGGIPDGMSREDAYYEAFRRYTSELNDYPNARQLALYLQDMYGVTNRAGDGPLSENTLRGYMRDFRDRYQESLDVQATP